MPTVFDFSAVYYVRLGTLALISIGLSQIACGGRGPLFAPHEYPKDRAHVTIEEVEILDHRASVTSEDLNAPKVTLPGTIGEAEVEITAATRGKLRLRLARLFADGPVKVKVQILVLRGLVGWRADWIREYTYVETAVDVIVTASECEVELLNVHGVAEKERGSLDVRDGDLNKRLQESVLVAFERALATVEAIRALNESAAHACSAKGP